MHTYTKISLIYLCTTHDTYTHWVGVVVLLSPHSHAFSSPPPDISPLHRHDTCIDFSHACVSLSLYPSCHLFYRTYSTYEFRELACMLDTELSSSSTAALHALLFSLKIQQERERRRYSKSSKRERRTYSKSSKRASDGQRVCSALLTERERGGKPCSSRRESGGLTASTSQKKTRGEAVWEACERVEDELRGRGRRDRLTIRERE